MTTILFLLFYFIIGQNVVTNVSMLDRREHKSNLINIC